MASGTVLAVIAHVLLHSQPILSGCGAHVGDEGALPGEQPGSVQTCARSGVESWRSKNFHTGDDHDDRDP